MLDEQRPVVNEDWEELFDGILHECAERLRKDPSDFAALVRGVTVYMVVIEGTLALTGARFIIRSLKERDWFPGFPPGFTAVNRDESRHVGFGVKFLADAIKDDPANAQIVEDTLKETLPVAPLVFVPPWVDDPYDFETPFYHSSGDLRVRAEVALEEARRDGARPGDARRRRVSEAATTRRPAPGAAVDGRARADPRGRPRGDEGRRLRRPHDRQGRGARRARTRR